MFTPPKKSTVKTREQELIDKCPDVEIAGAVRPDLLIIIVECKTQQLRLAGIQAPSPKSGSHNSKFSSSAKLDVGIVNKAGKQGIDLVSELTKDRPLKLVVLSKKDATGGNGLIDGDILFMDNSTLSEKLLHYGAACAVSDDNDTTIHYKRIEDEAKQAERGMWRHPVKIARRFYINSSFSSKTLNIHRSKVRASGNGRNDRLESHKDFEKQGEITINLRVRKPFFHPYEGTITYDFVLRRDMGKRVQEIHSAPIIGKEKFLRSKSSSSKNNRNPLTSAEREANRKSKKSDREYNRSAHGQNVFNFDSSGSKSIPFTLYSLSTNIIIKSDIVNYTKSTKGGTSYSHGQYYVGYNLEITIGTNLVYSRYHNQ